MSKDHKIVSGILIALMAGLMIIALLHLCGNYNLVTRLQFNRAIITLDNNNFMTVDVKSWSDNDNGGYIIHSRDGITYNVSAVNCTLLEVNEDE